MAIAEDLLNREQLEDEMSESTFDAINFSMEMGCLWWGEGENALFSYESLVNARKLSTAIYPSKVYGRIENKYLKTIEKKPAEIRILCADLAVMSSKKNKNDATAMFILQLLPTKDGQYLRNVLYAETFEGGHSETQALKIRKLYNETDCDYIVIDTNGVGIGIYDHLVSDMIDKEINITYDGLSCINDSEMASRYKGANKNPQKVIYSIKASAPFNSKCAWRLRDSIIRGKLRLLKSEQEVRTEMLTAKFYQTLSDEEKLIIEMPFIETTLLINELVNLDCKTEGSDIKVKEGSGKRKDRYSALSYGNYIADELEVKNNRRKKEQFGSHTFEMRAPKTKGGRSRRETGSGNIGRYSR